MSRLNGVKVVFPKNTIKQQQHIQSASARVGIWCVLITAAITAIPVWSCSVPVFRYAIEHWEPDAYQAVVFHRGPLTEQQRAVARDLSADGLAGKLHANISVRLVDLDQDPKPEMLDFWRQQGAATLPWLVVSHPVTIRSPIPIWSGPLTEQATREILESPARKEITARLAEGESAVWVLLESGDPKKDGEALRLIETRLAYLAGTLTLPKLDEQDIIKGLVSVPEDGLKLGFALLRVARSDPGEQAFIRMLLGSESDLPESKEPIAFPIFGRGRCLYALVGRGISRETIDQAATFLIGKCSCEVKEKNPGVDLLLSADWQTLVKAQFNPDRDLPVLTNFAGSLPQTVTISGGTPSSSRPSSVLGPIFGNIYVAGGLAVVGMVLAGISLMRKKSGGGKSDE
jgi:hypothetical protein